MSRPVVACADWLCQFLRNNGPTSPADVLAAAAAAGFSRSLVDKAAGSRHADVTRTREGARSVWSIPGRALRVVHLAEVSTAALDKPWSSFPWCWNCDEKVYQSSWYRHPQDPRGPLRLPSIDGRCPHCRCPLITPGGPAADLLARWIAVMTE